MAYKIYNAAMPTAGLQTAVTTGTAVKTMLQLATPSTLQVTPIAWGYTLSAVPGGTGGQVELIQTDVAATGLTAHVSANVYPSFPGAAASSLTFGTGATGYATGIAPTEGVLVTTRVFDEVLVNPTAGAQSMSYFYQWVPDERSTVAASTFLRVRVNFNAAVNMLCWVAFVQVG